MPYLHRAMTYPQPHHKRDRRQGFETQDLDEAKKRRDATKRALDYLRKDYVEADQRVRILERIQEQEGRK